jgi:hypothetical protein
MHTHRPTHLTSVDASERDVTSTSSTCRVARVRVIDGGRRLEMGIKTCTSPSANSSVSSFTQSLLLKRPWRTRARADATPAGASAAACAEKTIDLSSPASTSTSSGENPTWPK